MPNPTPASITWRGFSAPERALSEHCPAPLVHAPGRTISNGASCGALAPLSYGAGAHPFTLKWQSLGLEHPGRRAIRRLQEPLINEWNAARTEMAATPVGERATESGSAEAAPDLARQRTPTL